MATVIIKSKDGRELRFHPTNIQRMYKGEIIHQNAICDIEDDDPEYFPEKKKDGNLDYNIVYIPDGTDKSKDKEIDEMWDSEHYIISQVLHEHFDNTFKTIEYIIEPIEPELIK